MALPPASLAPHATIEEILRNVIKKLPRSPDVLVAIFANRGGGIAQTIEVPNHNLAGVCALGFTEVSPRTVFVVGYIGERPISATIPLKFA